MAATWIYEKGSTTGGAGGGVFAAHAVSGTKDGTNMVFTLAVALTIFQLFRNGVLQATPGDYTSTITGSTTTITFSVWPPASDDQLIAWG